MDIYHIALLVLLVVPCLFALIFYLKNSRLTDNLQYLVKEIETLKQEGFSHKSESDRLRDQLQVERDRRIEVEAEIKILKESKESDQKTFENLAQRVLDQKAQNILNQNKQTLEATLSPFTKQMRDFRDRVDKVHTETTQQHSGLSKELEHIVKMNQQLSQEATNLTKALQGSVKQQGDWGETQLEKVLQVAGLEEDIHYEKQPNVKDEDGKSYRPDFTLKLPRNRVIIIDSKVSLNSYVAYTAADNDTVREQHLKILLHNIIEHIKGLSRKDYPRLYPGKTVDYVVMFFPLDFALQLASQKYYKDKGEDLTTFAIDRRVALCNTQILMPMLRLIRHIWTQDKQQKNVQKVMEQATKMYEKLVGFSEDMIKVGTQIESAKKTYAGAMNKFSQGRGNLISQAEKLKNLGLNPTKEIDPKLSERAQDSLPDATL